MQSINGYQYITEQAAINAVKACNDYYGIPKSPEDVTQNWCSYSYDQDNFWYIVYDESLKPILGEPSDITLTPHEEL